MENAVAAQLPAGIDIGQFGFEGARSAWRDRERRQRCVVEAGADQPDPEYAGAETAGPMTSQVPSATVAASAAVNSTTMTRLRRAVPLVPYMSIAASRLTFTPAWFHTGARLRVT